MTAYALTVEVGEAGLLAVIEAGRTGELSPIAFVVIRNLAVQAKRAARQHEDELAARRPAPPTIRDEWVA